MREPTSIPAEQLYWGVIDTRGLPTLRPGAARARYANLFDAVLPIAVEDLHVIYRRVGTHAVLACGIEPDRLRAFRDAGALSVVPAGLPRGRAGVATELAGIDPRSLELLTGEQAPIALVSARRRRRRVVTVIMLLVSVLVAIGNLRRERACADAIDRLRAFEGDLLRDALGPDAGGVPAIVRLTTELRRFSMTRGDSGTLPNETDAALDLDSVLRVWPAGVDLRVERLAVSPDRIDLTVEADGTGAFERLIEAAAGLPGWELRERRIDRGNAARPFRARLGFERAEIGGGAS